MIDYCRVRYYSTRAVTFLSSSPSIPSSSRHDHHRHDPPFLMMMLSENWTADTGIATHSSFKISTEEYSGRGITERVKMIKSSLKSLVSRTPWEDASSCLPSKSFSHFFHTCSFFLTSPLFFYIIHVYSWKNGQALNITLYFMCASFSLTFQTTSKQWCSQSLQ